MARPEIDRIDPERLAALFEGRVSEPERSELLARLAKSPEDLALLADVAAVSRELQPGASSIGETRSVRGRWRPRNLGWLAIAAGVIGVTTVSIARRDAMRERGLPPDLAFAFPQWQAQRGGGVVMDSVTLSWRVGVRLADLDAAIAARDGARTSAFGRELEQLLSAGNVGLSSTYFGRIADSARADRGRLAELARAGRTAITSRVDVQIVDLANWLESARIAAHRDTAFFRRGDVERRMTELEARAPSAAREIRGAIVAADLSALKATLAAALETLGR